MLNILYTIFIYPLNQIIEFVFLAAFKVYENHGFAIIAVSITVSFLCLPLYIVAEKWQKLERDTVKLLKPKVDSIKTVFKGDEQYMMLQAYYKQNSYHPIYALRSSFGLIIQVPFFIAAYSFLSNLEILKGKSFLFINDLGSPDALYKINILPVIMTLINVLSCIIYTKKLSVRDKIQAYGMAAIFLPLLYNSPSGLVLYWTMNNLFSLFKNVFYYFKKPYVALYIILCSLAALLDIYLLFFHYGNFNKRLMLITAISIIFFMPLLIKIFNRIYIYIKIENKFIYLLLSLSILCLLLGFVTPSFVISSSPQEFSYIDNVSSPFQYLFNCFLQALGFCIFLPFCIYFMFGERIKTLLVILSTVICWLAIVNTFLFSGNYGSLSSMLTFSNAGTIPPTVIMGILNIIVIITVVLIVLFLFIKNGIIINILSIIMIISLFGISIYHSYIINREYKQLTSIMLASNNSISQSNNYSNIEPVFNFSKTDKNVLVIFLDRGTGFFLPHIFQEIPGLLGQYKGFIYYPNTISFSTYTLMGAPAVFGGYEYTPAEINKRAEVSLVQKHNESLLLMPLIFLENSYNVTVTDPPWANYSWIPDTRIFSPYPEINVKNTIRTYTDIWLEKNEFPGITIKSNILKRNFIWFSLFKAAPLFMRDSIYKNGEWWSTDTSAIDFILLLNNYALLDLLPELTKTNSNEATFTILSNDLPHEPFFLQAPYYRPGASVNNYGTSIFAGNPYYHVNAAAIIRLGEWFDFLKKNECFDNTRIIITSDHGPNFHSGIFSNSNETPFNKEFFNPLLMLKDFNADFELVTDNTFMTNADTPSLAFRDLITNPVNPFTNNPVNDSAKNEKQIVTTSSGWMPNHHGSTTFKIEPDEWYSVHTDIFNEAFWQRAE